MAKRFLSFSALLFTAVPGLLLVPLTASAAEGENPALAGLAENTWTLMSPTVIDASGADVTSDGFPYNGYSGLVYDPCHHALLMFGGGGHGTRRGNDVWRYDTAANTWRQDYAPDPQTAYPYSVDDSGMTYQDYCQSTDPLTCDPAAEWSPRGTTTTGRPWTSHSYDQLAYDTFNDRLVFFGPNFVFGYDTAHYYGVPDAFTYDGASKSWTHLQTAPDLYHQMASAEYDPLHQVVIATGGSWTQVGYKYMGTPQVWALDAKTEAWSRRADPPRQFHDVSMVYDSTNGRMLVYGGDYPASDELWSYDAGSDQWTELAPTPDGANGAPPAGAPNAAFDSRNGVLLLFGQGDTGSLIPTWAYLAATNQWKKMNPAGGEPASSAGVGANLAYDSVNNVFWLVLPGGQWGEHGQLFAYRYADAPAAALDACGGGTPTPPGGSAGAGGAGGAPNPSETGGSSAAANGGAAGSIVSGGAPTGVGPGRVSDAAGDAGSCSVRARKPATHSSVALSIFALLFAAARRRRRTRKIASDCNGEALTVPSDDRDGFPVGSGLPLPGWPRIPSLPAASARHDHHRSRPRVRAALDGTGRLAAPRAHHRFGRALGRRSR
jgi:hypothetical protein